LIIGETLDDDLDDDGEGGLVIYSDHKFRGRPYSIQDPELDGAEELMKRGFVQVLQLDFPGAADGAVRGNWPFFDGLFNLFMLPERPSLYEWAVQK